MTKLLSNDQMVRYFRHQVRQNKILAALAGERPKRVTKIPASLPAVTEQRRAPERPSGEPPIEREVKAEAVERTKTPPFNSRVLGPAQKLARGLGPEAMIVLERLYEIGNASQIYRGMVQSYEGASVDNSSADYQHMTASSRDSLEQFQAILAKMPQELQKLTRELVVEDLGMETNSARGAPPRRARTVREIGQELAGYETEQRAIGAVAAALRIISWIARDQLGMKRRKR